MANKLKPFIDFQTRSGIVPHFDMGDLVTDGKEILLVLNITSSREWVDDVSTTKAEYLVLSETRLREYHLFNKTFRLLKKGDNKIKYFIYNTFHIDAGVDVYAIVNGEIAYPKYFETAYNKILKK